ncbi:MAG: hypothetical protein K2X03_24495 [Bryobacteraceae bacterium]|nr:hypothetical protein [Bryobacteraceae bacterium]
MKSLSLVVTAVNLFAAVHSIKPGDDPQRTLDQAAAGDRIVFLPGLHLHAPRKHRSLLYVDKPVDIEFSPGATLKVKDRSTVLEKTPEITTDHGAPKTIDDFSVGGDYDLGLGPTIYTIRIDSEGKNGAPDTFTWGAGKIFTLEQEHVPITGEWQLLSHGVKIRFEKKYGHSLGSLWFLSYDGPETYGIRIGHGTQTDYIENVRIFGKGTIDLNSDNNVEPSLLVKDINACILVHGRVRHVNIEDVTMTNTHRSVMVYGEHTGKFLQGGATGPGESFDAEDISICRTRTLNPRGSGYLLGHPSHRGRLSKVRCNQNFMETATTAIEPNFNLDQYEVIGNVIKSEGRAIHCWRRSTNGLVKDNVRIDDPTGKEVVMVNAPGAWQPPENIVLRDNRNHLSEPLGYWASVSGGFGNSARGAYASAAGGRQNEASGPYSQAQGWQARADRPGEAALAAGAFAQVGDAQSSELTAKALTTGDAWVELSLAGEAGIAIAPQTTAAFRLLIVARSESGLQQAAFSRSGVATRTTDGVSVSAGEAGVIQRTAPEFETAVSGGERLRLLVKGPPATKVRWVARVELAEVRF